jgi:hypothetical protein
MATYRSTVSEQGQSCAVINPFALAEAIAGRKIAFERKEPQR